MSNREKYDAAFIQVFEIEQSQLNSTLEYQSVKLWDSVGHMALVAELEDVFDIMLEMDDIGQDYLIIIGKIQLGDVLVI